MLALIAGTGRLPALVAAAAGPLLICRPEGETADLNFRLERLVPFLETLCERGVKEVCFAGAMTRPDFDPSALDPATAARLPEIAAALALGDDGTLRFFASLFAEYGMEVRGAHEVAPELLAPEGAIEGQVSKGDQADAELARQVLDHLSPLDVTQGCVVAGGRVLGIETIQGTEVLLSFVAKTRAPYAGKTGGVLVKRPKNGQDLRFDMPAIGPDTIGQAAEAGLSGVSVAAGKSLILDRKETVEAAEAAGITLWGEP